MFATTSFPTPLSPGDQNVCVGRRHGVDQLLDLLHHLAGENRAEASLGILEPLLELDGFFAELFPFPNERLLFQRLFNKTDQLFRLRTAC